MNAYTAEDFKNANIAVRGTLHAARRAEPDTTLPWVYGDNEWDDDKGMVENGWRPIVEVEDPEAIVALIGRQATRIRELEGERESAHLTLDTLREAWENAEVPTSIYAGETIIQRDTGGESFSVYVADRGHPLAPVDIRVLHSAPQPEPRRALAEAFSSIGFGVHMNVEEAAEIAYERGVRLVGGDET